MRPIAQNRQSSKSTYRQDGTGAEPPDDGMREAGSGSFIKVTGHDAREQHDGHGEDKRYHAGAVNAQRNMGAAGLAVHAAAAENAAGILYRHTAVRLGKDDDQDYRNQDDDDVNDQPGHVGSGQEAFLDKLRVTGDDAAEDDDGNTVTDAVFGDKLAQPDQEERAGD